MSDIEQRVKKIVAEQLGVKEDEAPTENFSIVAGKKPDVFFFFLLTYFFFTFIIIIQTQH
jgi:hypothetical protein